MAEATGILRTNRMQTKKLRPPRTKARPVATLALLLVFFACSPRDFLTRRLASDLITAADSFRSPQQFWLRTGAVANQDYASPEYLVLQRHGWITGSNMPCPPTVGPPPCWGVVLSPLGVETFRDLIPSGVTPSSYFSVPVSQRQLIEVTGISKNGNLADVDFLWKWVPLNEVGAALSPAGPQYRSTVQFKHYDDGWRVVEGSSSKSGQSLDEALKGAELTK
jgi:hypothetical protein